MINIPSFKNDDELNKFVEKTSSKNTISVDNRDLFFCVALDNSKQRTLFTKSSIETLVIEDDLFSWYQKGYITIRNKGGAFERSMGPEKILSLLNIDDAYKVRGDSRDILSISITPKIDYFKTFITKISGLEAKPDSDIYTLSNDYAVYDTKSEYMEDGTQLKTLYFWDLRYQLLLERNIHYSTSLVKSKDDKEFGKEIRMVNNIDRSIKSGDAIRSLIEQGLEDLKPEFEDKLWDKGGTTIFYSSPAQYKGINDLDWLMEHHVSSDDADNDFSILKYDAYIKKWTLIPIKSYFDKAIKGDAAGEYQYDKFHVSEHQGKVPLWMSLLSGKKKAPKLKIEDLNSRSKSKKTLLPIINKLPRKNINSGESTELENMHWKFEDLAGLDNQTLLTTYAVHSYNIDTHEFNIDVYNNEIQTVAEKFQENYIDGKFLGDKPTLNFQITPNKKDRNVMDNMYCLDNDEKIRQASGRNILYKNLIFLNHATSLNVKGDTHRRTGRFFSLDRKDTYFENELDEKMLGQYFTVNVKHIFEQDKYRNELIGVKPYRTAAPEFEPKKIIK